MPRFIPPKACHSCRDSPGMAQINPCQLGKVTQIHVSRNMEATEHLLVVWAQCYVWCVLSVLFSGRMLIKRGWYVYVPRPVYCLSGMAISQGLTGRCSWPTCQMGSPKHPVRRKVCVQYLYMLIQNSCCITFDLSVSMADALKEGPSLLLVLKWGGELTPAGRVQAEELGRAFRCMYPGGQGITLYLHQPESCTNKLIRNTVALKSIL